VDWTSTKMLYNLQINLIFVGVFPKSINQTN